MPNPNVVDTDELEAAAWALHDHPDKDVRDLALGANEAAHDIRVLLQLVDTLTQRATTAELALLQQTSRTARMVEAYDDVPGWLDTLRQCGAL